jgi:hypothetical protein
MLEFIQNYGQTILFGLFIAILLLLLLFMVFAHPKATCCATSRLSEQHKPPSTK